VASRSQYEKFILEERAQEGKILSSCFDRGATPLFPSSLRWQYHLPYGQRIYGAIAFASQEEFVEKSC
jgi:hypothetical protein